MTRKVTSPTTADTLLFDGLSGGYGTADVIQNISGAVEAGRALCVVGRNGVGKSTLIRLLSGHLRPSAGKITLGDQDITKLAPHRRQGLGISVSPQERPVFDNLSVRENLILMQNSNDVSRFEPYFEAFPILKNRLNQHAGTLSGGERKMLSFARCLSEGTPIMLLDEPSEGVQRENIEKMAELIEDAKSNGTAFLIVEQHLAFAESIADVWLVMDHGSTVLTGDAAETSHNDILQHLQV
jgi:ABC-type branched-subunit amino acid transport system ATPase component